MKKISILFFIIIFYNNFSFANEATVIDLSKSKWEYRWGDSPFEKGIPLWSIEKGNDSLWKSIAYPSNPPDRNEQTNVWYRVKLPDVLSKDPHVYIFSIDILPEVYYKGERIYHFGEIDEGKGTYEGWPWHMFSIPLNSAGEYLYFRIYSHYMDIGLFGEILISSKGELYKKMLDYDIPKIMTSSVSIFVAFILLVSFLSKFRKVEIFILGLLFLSQGLTILCSVKIIDLYFFHPLLKQYILAITFFFFPVGMAAFLDKTVKNKIPFNPIRRIWQIHLLYIIGATFGSLGGFFDISAAYTYYDKIFYFFSLPILTLFLVYYFFKGDTDTKLITSSFMIISLYWIYSFLIAYHILPWTEYPSDAAIFLCLLILSYAIVKRLSYTSKLEYENKQLYILSSTDYLTKLYNRKELDELLTKAENIAKRYHDEFSIILLDIDDFKKVNDTYGHLAGDEFLIEFGNILTSVTRETDFVGRWGGEEFLIICPKANKENALKAAENLREEIEKHKFKKVEHKTASFGVSTYKEGDSLIELVARADEAMYASKSQGKNKVSFK